MADNRPSDSMTESAREPAASPALVDGLPVRSPVIIGESQGNAILWQIDLLGNPCGAWVVPYDGSNTAGRLVAMCHRRALVVVEPERHLELLAHWMTDAGEMVDGEQLTGRVCSIPTVLDEIVEARGKLEAAVQDVGTKNGKRLEPLVWRGPVLEQVPRTSAGLMQTSGFVPAHGPLESREVRSLVRLAQWALQIWRDTETVRLRRRYLRESFGPAQVLTPSWRRALIAAYEATAWRSGR